MCGEVGLVRLSCWKWCLHRDDRIGSRRCCEGERRGPRWQSVSFGVRAGDGGRWEVSIFEEVGAVAEVEEIGVGLHSFVPVNMDLTGDGYR